MTRLRRPGMMIFLTWALLCGLVCACSAAYLRVVWSVEESAAYRSAETAAELAEQTLLRTTEGLTAVLDMVSARMVLSEEHDELGAALIDRGLSNIVRNQSHGVRGASFVDAEGIIRWTLAGQPVGTSVVNREVYGRVIVQGETFAMTSPVASRRNGYWISLAGRRMDGPQEALRGMALVAFDPLHLGRLLGMVAAREGRVLLVRHRADGQIHAASHDPDGRLSRAAAREHPVVSGSRLADAGRVGYRSPVDGRVVLTAWRNVGADFIAQASFNQSSEVVAPFRRIAAPVLAATALFVFGSLVMAVAWDRNAHLRRRLEELATRDPLTGLHNRRALEQRVVRLLEAPGAVPAFACLLFDIDHFKGINDHYGHAAGDEVLCRVAAVMAAEIRGSDIVCRWGGEEMLVILAGCPRDRALVRAEALRAAIGALAPCGPHPAGRITASVGVACYPPDGKTLSAVVSEADAAMYRAKRAGRNRVATVEAALAA